MSTLASLYSAHVQELTKRATNVLARENLDAIVIHSGQEKRIFLDDNSYPFKVNPHFKHWLPVTDIPNCWLIIKANEKPVLIYYQPVDFWHKVIELKDDYWNAYFDIQLLSNATDVEKLLPYDKKGFAYIGEHIEVAKALGFDTINPEPLLNYLHYHRAYKTAYEQECMRQSNAIAVAGHRAAKLAFINKGSEYDILQSYLSATKLMENETPYGNIITLNENASILHYFTLERKAPAEHRSFLIDAGANFHGYAADISRTYAYEQNHFAELIAQMDALMLDVVDQLKPGKSYVDVHVYAFERIAALLKDVNLINVAPEVAIEAGVVGKFFPHGIGHPLGLQVHDVGAFMADERGTHIKPPEPHVFLRSSRMIECNQVFTIEPGLYFINSLLNEVKDSANRDMVNWHEVERYRPFGGIRIEDNIIVHQSHNENMTRDLGLTS